MTKNSRLRGGGGEEGDAIALPTLLDCCRLRPALLHMALSAASAAPAIAGHHSSGHGNIQQQCGSCSHVPH